MATGYSQQTVAFSYRLGRTTVHNIIKETCRAIWDSLAEQYLSVPTTADQWINIAHQFYELWQFPNCLSAIDGKHVVIQAPSNSGSEFYNYKGTYSIVLLAACDARYCFTMVDIGASGRESDGGVFGNSKFDVAIQNNTLNLPTDGILPGSNQSAPFVFVADNAFPLCRNLMKPFAGKQLPYNESVFNYRLSRARRVIENSFGILTTRWRLFRRPIIAKPENVVEMVKAACVLHNFLQRNNEVHAAASSYCPEDLVDTYDRDGNLIPGAWRQEGHGNLLPRSVHSNRYGQQASNVRKTFVDYFVSATGQVPWQRSYVLSSGPSVQ